MSTGITLQATFARASTTVDGGWRLTFDVGQDQAPEIMRLAVMRDTLFQVALVPIDSLLMGDDFDG